MQLNKKFFSVVQDKLRETLEEVEVCNGQIVSFTKFEKLSRQEISLEDPQKGDNQQINALLTDLIGDDPFYDFIISEVLTSIQQDFPFKDDSVVKLTSLPAYSELDDTCQKLIAKFCLLPFKYTFFLRVSDSFKTLFASNDHEIVFSSELSLVLATQEFQKTFHLKGTSRFLYHGELDRQSLLGGLSGEKWDSDSPYLSIKVEGYIGQFVSENTISNVMDSAKSFFGLLVALRNARYEYAPRYLSSPNVMYSFTVNGKSVENEESIILDSKLSNATHGVQVNAGYGLGNSSKPYHGFPKAIIELMSNILRNKHRERILRAGKWFFDAMSERNGLLSYLYFTILVEILLGGEIQKGVDGITKTLSNRCAYFIGNTPERRDELLKIFPEIYQVRSDIVHKGKSRLTRKEKEKLNQLETICRDLINKEASLIVSSNKQNC